MWAIILKFLIFFRFIFKLTSNKELTFFIDIYSSFLWYYDFFTFLAGGIKSVKDDADHKPQTDSFQDLSMTISVLLVDDEIGRAHV